MPHILRHAMYAGTISGRQALAALGATARQHVTSADCGHPVAESVAALAHDLARLIGAFHVTTPSRSIRDEQPPFGSVAV